MCSLELQSTAEWFNLKYFFMYSYYIKHLSAENVIIWNKILIKKALGRIIQFLSILKWWLSTTKSQLQRNIYYILYVHMYPLIY